MSACENNCPVTNSGCTPLCADSKPKLEFAREEVTILLSALTLVKIRSGCFSISAHFGEDLLMVESKIEKFLEVTK